MFNNELHQNHDRKISEQDFLSLDLDKVYIIDVRNSFELSRSEERRVGKEC